MSKTGFVTGISNRFRKIWDDAALEIIVAGLMLFGSLLTQLVCAGHCAAVPEANPPSGQRAPQVDIRRPAPEPGRLAQTGP